MRGVTVRVPVAVARDRAVRAPVLLENAVRVLEGRAPGAGAPRLPLHLLRRLGSFPRGPHAAARVAQLSDRSDLLLRVVLLRLHTRAHTYEYVEAVSAHMITPN